MWVDKDRVSGEVSQQVQSWRSSTESGDINALIRKYAPSVQYHRKSDASPEFIRADKQRAYRLFDSMSIRISNMDVSVSDSGETATAQFRQGVGFRGNAAIDRQGTSAASISSDQRAVAHHGRA